MRTRRLVLVPVGGGLVGVLWGLGSGTEAVDSALGTGLMGLAVGALAAVAWQAASRRRQR